MDSMTFVLFGASGDLAKRKIYPALYNLFLDQKMPQSFSVIGLGRRDWSDNEYQMRVEQSLKTFSRRFVIDSIKMKEFLSAFRFFRLDVNNEEGFRDLFEFVKKREEELNIPENRMFYLSVAPEFIGVIASNIKKAD